MKVAVAPESVPRLGARAALEIPPMAVEVHRWIRHLVVNFRLEDLPEVETASPWFMCPESQAKRLIRLGSF